LHCGIDRIDVAEQKRQNEARNAGIPGKNGVLTYIEASAVQQADEGVPCKLSSLSEVEPASRQDTCQRYIET